MTSKTVRGVMASNSSATKPGGCFGDTDSAGIESVTLIGLVRVMRPRSISVLPKLAAPTQWLVVTLVFVTPRRFSVIAPSLMQRLPTDEAGHEGREPLPGKKMGALHYRVLQDVDLSAVPSADGRNIPWERRS